MCYSHFTKATTSCTAMNEGHQYVKGEVSVIDYSYNLLHVLL